MGFKMTWNNDLIVSIKPIFFFCQCFGLHSSDLTFNPKKPTPSFKKNLLRIYTICLLMFIVTMFVVMTKNTMISDVNVIVQVADMVVVYSHVFLGIIDMFGNFRSRFEIENTVYSLMKTETILRNQLSIVVSYKSLKKFVYAQLIAAVFIWVFFIYYYTFVLCTHRMTCVANILAYYIACQISHIHVIQFCTLITTITIFFKAINNKLTELSAKNQNHITNHQGVQWVGKNTDDVNKELKVFIIIRQIYDQLYDTARKLNRAYSLQLLFTFANGFVVIFCSIYGTIFGYVFEGKVTDKDNTAFMFLPLILFMVTSLKVLMVTLSCENLVNESQYTGVIIHKISLATTQRAIKEIIQDFSLQLVHQCLQISAFGFFDIDCSLLQTIVGAVTTYLIILIQFDLAMPKNAVLFTGDPTMISNLTTSQYSN